MKIKIRLCLGWFGIKSPTLHLLPAFLLLADALLWPAVSFAQQASTGLTTEQFLAWARASLSGIECQEVDERWRYTGLPISDQKVMDTMLYVVDHSTDSECVTAYVSMLMGAVANPIVARHLKADKKAWAKMGLALIVTMHKSYAGDSHAAFAAGETLQDMGPPYQEAAYQYFLDEMESLAHDKKIDDGKRWEAIMLLREFYFHEPREAYPGLYKKTRHKPPVILFRAVNKNLDLASYWQSHLLNGTVEKQMLSEFKNFVEK